MTEKFLHYLWSMKLLRNNLLETVTGEKIQVISAGDHNTDAGPDFLNTRLRIGDTLWAGNVEIHLKSSDWVAHHHQHDQAYDNIILHAVFEDDLPIHRGDGSRIPCMVMKHQFDPAIYEQYKALMGSHSRIPCEPHIHKVPAMVIRHWMHRLMIERMEVKIQPLLSALRENQNNWEETFYQFLAMSYGSRLNAEPFLQLARALPLKVLARHKNNLLQLEALLFGTAGLLAEEFSDEYPQMLKKEFSFLMKKYGLVPLKKHAWKFLRLRPANFPTVRLSQFSQLIFSSSHLFSKVVDTLDINQVCACFDVTASGYWDNHYLFEHRSHLQPKVFGRTATELLIINTIVPFLFLLGKQRGESHLCERAIIFLESIPAEENKILKTWNSMGIAFHDAFESQALLQLHNHYCKNFRCLECAIGHQVLSQKAR